MGKYVIDETTLRRIAAPLRTLDSRNDALLPAEMASIGAEAVSVVETQGELITRIGLALQNKTAGGSSGDPTLPAGYVRCGFIRFDGTQAVDIGVIGTQETKIKVRYIREDSTAAYLYGTASSGNTASLTAYLSSGGSWRFGNKYVNRNVVYDADMIQLAIVSKSGIKHDDGTSAYSGVTAFETPGTLILGGCRQTSGAVDAQFVGKVLDFEIGQGDALQAKLVPVVSLTGVYRFWDDVSGTFLDSVTDTPLGGGNL